MLIIKQQQYTQLCDSRETAIELLHKCLEAEVNLVKSVAGYTPSVLEPDEDDITLMYAEGYEDIPANYDGESFKSEDFARFGVIEVNHIPDWRAIRTWQPCLPAHKNHSDNQLLQWLSPQQERRL